MTDQPKPGATQKLVCQAIVAHVIIHKLADLRLREMRHFWDDDSFPDDLCNKVAREEADKLRKLAMEVNNG